MKILLSKHKLYKRKRHDFISLFTLLFLFSGLAILIYLLLFCQMTDRFCPDIQAKAKGEEISEALPLSEDAVCQIHLTPYNHRYYYFQFHQGYCMQSLSASSPIKLLFYNDKGKRITVSEKNKELHFSRSIFPGDRIFLKCTNTSANKASTKLRYCKISEKKTKKQHDTAAKSDQAHKNRKVAKKHARTTGKTTQTTKRHTQTTSKTTQTAKRHARTTGKTTQTAKKHAQTARKPNDMILVEPHFIHLTPGSTKKLSISLNHAPVSLAACTYFSTDSSMISVKGSTITAKKTGTVILYIKPKKASACSSCLIRIYS